MRLACLALFCLALFTGCGGSGDDDGGDNGGPDAMGTTGSPCGGFAGIQCDERYYCDWDDDSCGGADGLGVCMPRPEVCTTGPSVCGCDGMPYTNACQAAQHGADVSTSTTCEL